MEQHITASNPEVSGALVIGAQRFQAALLIESVLESSLTTAEQAALIERIWPSVEEANRHAPAHAQVDKAFILIVPSDRRLIRAGKGTFMRGPSISQYEAEIDRLYANADTADEQDDCQTFHDMSPDAVIRVIRENVLAITKWRSFDKETNFFDNGMDSLQGLQLVRALRRSLHQPGLALSTVYQNPTAPQLADAILQGQTSQDEHQLMKDLLTTFKGRLQEVSTSRTPDSPQNVATGPAQVLLTGSTGTVGTYLLRALLDSADVGHVFCLNRGEDGGTSAQHERFATAGLSNTGLEDRVTFIRADLQKPLFGLKDSLYESLRTQVSLVIHAAWPVNFNLPLSSFRPQLTGLVNLLGFTASTPITSARCIFISSVSAVEGHQNGPAPELVLDSLETPAPLGYARSKFLGELLVDFAAKMWESTISATIIRVGQVAGPVQGPGLWNPQEWFPSLILSSLHMGMVPNSLGKHFDSVDFVPADHLANILIDLTVTTSPEVGLYGSRVYNVRNPNITPWAALLPVVTEAVEPHLELVSPETWLARLRSISDTGLDGDDTMKSPAVKLIEFFAGLWSVDIGATVERMIVDNAVRESPTLRALDPVKLDWLRKWMGEWTVVQEHRSG